MKPPHNNRPGGSSRPPSDRGPFRGGGPNRPPGPGRGPRTEQRSPQGGEAGHRDQTPRHGGGFGGGGHGGSHGGGGGFQPRGQPHRGHAGPPRHAPEAPRGTVWLYGHHAVAAALANRARRLRRLLLTEEAEAAIGRHLAPPWALTPERVDRGRLDHLLGRDIVHQGAALLADPLAPPSLQSVLDKPGTIIVLDQITDPRNVGAIMRSAAAFGAAAVITQDRNAPEETGALAKAASGALETIPLLRAVNIARTIIALKAAHIWCIGLDAAGKPLSGPEFADRRVALVLGNEGEGLRRLTRETCDEIAGLTIKGAVESLNVSAAAAIALYELSHR
ncbi:MAG TPA: RNA methyltransferase [Rhodopila sp.]|nr:RNA methyltransferase [Rhodopila sp.]